MHQIRLTYMPRLTRATARRVHAGNTWFPVARLARELQCFIIPAISPTTPAIESQVDQRPETFGATSTSLLIPQPLRTI